ncbi:protein-ADP-ribose hydrolase [Candidatus Epulonipiscium viviparus]|uniref:protein-ADP-ribose hydrolase n=1 Tax=Candidatus Epulonipiscium viviparus TaxID=420336 RepID=UPI0027380440|nr:protein-ADP-ribose hydrolase [Candidatus Epulopiscium viviparus]
MNQSERLDYLVTHLAAEYSDLEIPQTFAEKRNLLRALMNVRKPIPISDEWLQIQDAFLSQEIAEKGIISREELITDDGNIFVWKGDITRLQVDAIVNAANSQLLGCFIPNHHCIDNAIHSAAGLQLRQACDGIISKQGHPEATGSAKMTAAFNLPCRYVIHTVGPIVHDKLTPQNEEDLANCYKSSLSIAAAENCHVIAFCCISTGEFHFPNRRAAEIAIKIVKNFLTENDKIKVVFNVFKDIDYKIYSELLRTD